MSVINVYEMKEVREVGICKKQRMHMSIFRLDGGREMMEDKEQI